MTDVLEKFELPVRPFCEHRGAERLHDLLDGDASVGELIFGAAHQPESPHSDRLEIDVPGGDLEDPANDPRET